MSDVNRFEEPRIYTGNITPLMAEVRAQAYVECADYAAKCNLVRIAQFYRKKAVEERRMHRLGVVAALLIGGLVALSPSQSHACPDSSPVCVNAGLSSGVSTGGGFGSPRLLSEARRWVGAGHRQLGVPSRLWCMDAVNVWLRRTGHKTTSSRRAIDAVKVGSRVSRPAPGVIGIVKRRGGHHVFVIDQVHGRSVTAISPNSGRRVRVAQYDIGRIIAMVQPN